MAVEKQPTVNFAKKQIIFPEETLACFTVKDFELFLKKGFFNSIITQIRDHLIKTTDNIDETQKIKDIITSLETNDIKKQNDRTLPLWF